MADPIDPPVFDPELPAENSLLTSAELRNQFQGLKAEIDGKMNADSLAGEVVPLTAGNCETVAELGLAVSDPPTQEEVQAIANKLDELLIQLRRS